MGPKNDSRIIGIHLDLKGVAFRPRYIPQLMRDLSSQGINAVLVEYEDVFPFDGIELAYDQSAVWSTRTLRAFQREATKNGIQVIPLQACLGHLEYVFRWKRYIRYAEDRAYPSTLRLSSPKGKALIQEMLRQVIEAHPDSQYVHLGMDEARGLAKAAERSGRDVLELFLEYLRELIDLVERYGKTPIIWSDMIEDHFEPGAFGDLKDRVVLNLWDYGSSGKRGTRGRVWGWRTSKSWLEEPGDPRAPAIAEGTRYFEELPKRIRSLIQPYLHDREIDSFFQVDLWTKMGFRILGGTAVRASAHGAVLPRCLRLSANIHGFAEAILRSDQLGLIGTSWARGTTFCPPNFSIDLTWPSVAVLAESMGVRPEPFFKGVPRKRLDRILGQLSRCRDDWSIEKSIAEELASLEPKVRSHQYEWNSLLLMVRTLALHRRADFALLEVDHFLAGDRPVTPEWKRRLRDQKEICAELAALRQDVRDHFSKRYHGAHFEEWLRDLFDVKAQKLQECGAICRARSQRARATYGW